MSTVKIHMPFNLNYYKDDQPRTYYRSCSLSFLGQHWVVKAIVQGLRYLIQMNSKDIIEKVDFKSFINSKACDPITLELIIRSGISDTEFPIPPEIPAYDDQDKNTLKSIIEFRSRNLELQGRQLNGADLCAASLEASQDEALRSWVPLPVDDFLVIFIINSKSFLIDGCMSLKRKS